MSFNARYRDTCAADCNEPIEEGDLVEYVDEQLVHEGCIPLAGSSATGGSTVLAPLSRRVCDECFTEVSVSGACAC